jgi:hypothetical protein
LQRVTLGGLDCGDERSYLLLRFSRGRTAPRQRRDAAATGRWSRCGAGATPSQSG